MTVTLDHTRDEASNIRTFFFKPEKPSRYTAGQFIELTLPHKHVDNRGDRRWFTLSSSPNDELLSITSKRAHERSSSFKRALFTLEPGDQLQMSDAMGDFVLPKLIQSPLIFVVGGIGITPVHSILTWLSQTEEERPIKLLYGVPNEDEIIFQDTIKKAGVHATIIVENPSAAWGGERGQLSTEKIIGLEQPSEDTLIYISGPELMVEHYKKDLVENGINRSQIVVDAFPNYITI